MPITALAVDVPEAEPMVGSLREQHDPTVRLGVPAHITVLVPFMAPEQLTPAIEARLERTFRMHPAFDFTLAGVGRFPGVAFLAPEPAARFIALTEAVVSEFPDHPPYGGEFSSIVPHLTVAHGSEGDANAVAGELQKRLAAEGPVRARCQAVVLLENSTGLWRRKRSFLLGPG